LYLFTLLIPDYPVNPIHIRSQCIRDNHTSVFLLVVLKYRHHRSSYGKTRTVKSMNILDL